MIIDWRLGTLGVNNCLLFSVSANEWICGGLRHIGIAVEPLSYLAAEGF